MGKQYLKIIPFFHSGCLSKLPKFNIFYLLSKFHTKNEIEIENKIEIENEIVFNYLIFFVCLHISIDF